MLLAHLRGLLKPYYDQGIRSIIAERATLMALGAEIQAGYESQLLVMQSSFASLTQGQDAKKLFSELGNQYHGVVDRGMLNFSRVKGQVSAEAKGLISLFETLNQSGFFDDLNRSTDKTLREMGWKRD